MNLTMTPSGVEQMRSDRWSSRPGDVNLTMTPSGVEQHPMPRITITLDDVNLTMTPSGVEQRWIGVPKATLASELDDDAFGR